MPALSRGSTMGADRPHDSEIDEWLSLVLRGVLCMSVCWGCCNKELQAGWLKPQKVIFSRSGD